MAPKPASTAGKAPASTASKAPAKPAEGAKAAKKTSKASAPADGEKKKRKKVRKETYSSYIYKGMFYFLSNCHLSNSQQSSSRSTPIPVSPTRPWPSSTRLSTTFSSALPLRHPVRSLFHLSAFSDASQNLLLTPRSRQSLLARFKLLSASSSLVSLPSTPFRKVPSR